MALSFNKVTKIITVLAPAVATTIQDLLNDIREYEDELTSLDIPKIASCAGKEALGGGVYVGLTLTLLDNWKIVFEARPGPTYVQCEISGGNIVALDESGLTTYAIEPTAFTQIVRTSSASATLQELRAIQYSSFDCKITIDVINGVAGTTFPSGTMESPVNNLADAKIIAVERGFGTIYVIGDLTIDTGGNYTGISFIGESITKTKFTISSVANVTDCAFYEATITGTLDGNTKIKNCNILDLDYIYGVVEECILGPGTITLGGGGDITQFLDCWSGGLGVNAPVIDCGGTGQVLAVRNYNGRLILKNSTGGDKTSIDLNSGYIILETATFTNSDFRLRGIGELTDTEGNHLSCGTWNGNVEINCSGLLNPFLIGNKILDDSRTLTTNKFLGLK